MAINYARFIACQSPEVVAAQRVVALLGLTFGAPSRKVCNAPVVLTYPQVVANVGTGRSAAGHSDCRLPADQFSGYAARGLAVSVGRQSAGNPPFNGVWRSMTARHVRLQLDPTQTSHRQYGKRLLLERAAASWPHVECVLSARGCQSIPPQMRLQDLTPSPRMRDCKT